MTSGFRRPFIASGAIALLALLLAVAPAMAAPYWPATRATSRTMESAFLLDSAGRAHVITAGYSSIRYVREKPDGMFTTGETVVAHGGRFPSATIDPSTGRLVVVYTRIGCSDCTPEDFIGLYMTQQKAGGGWTAPVRLTASTADGASALRIRKIGTTVRWYLAWERSGEGIMYRTRTATTGWTTPTRIAYEPGLDPLFFTSELEMRIDPRGYAHLTYLSAPSDDTDRPDGIMYLTNGSRTAGWQGTMVRVGPNFDHPAIVIDANGILHMAYAGAHRTSTGVMRSGTWYARHDTRTYVTTWGAPSFVSTASDHVSLTLDELTPVATMTDFSDGIWFKRRKSDGTWPAGTHVKPANNDDAEVRVTPSTAPAAVGARKARILYTNFGSTGGTFLARQP
jgi:hypothetical protein